MFLILCSILIPLLHPEVNSIELVISLGIFGFALLMQLAGSLYFHFNPTDNSPWFCLWKGVVPSVMITLGLIVSFFLLNEKVDFYVLLLMILTIPVIASLVIVNRLTSPDYSFIRAVEVGRFKKEKWHCFYSKKFYISDKTDKDLRLKFSCNSLSGVIGLCAAFGGAFSGASVDVYLLYIVELVICSGMVYLFAPVYFLDIIYLFKAGFSHKIKELTGT